MNPKVLFVRIKKLVATERRIGVEILECLFEIERRKAYAELRYDGLFTYCVKELGFTDSQAYQRIQAMRALKEIPELKPAIESGALSVSAVAKVQTHFRREKKEGVSSSREEKLALFKTVENLTSRETDAKIAESRGEVLREKLFVEMDEELAELWTRVKNLAAHRSGGDSTEVLKMLSREWLKKNDPAEKPIFKNMKLEVVEESDLKAEPIGSAVSASVEANSRISETGVPAHEQPQSQRSVPWSTQVTPQRSRYIRPVVKREVWRRDGGVCANCRSKHALEFDHRRPFAMGGEHTKENLRLLCRSCNRAEAIRAFGVDKIRPRSV